MAMDKVYWDSMVFVCRMRRDPTYIADLELITAKAQIGDLLIITSVFTTAEVAMVSDAETDDTQEKMIVDFFENSFIRTMPVSREICAKARELMRSTRGLLGKDAIHVATAVMTPGITVMHSYEKKLIGMTGKIPGSSLNYSSA